MATLQSNTHDAYFRQVLSSPAHAAGELRAALPDQVAARIDWNTLELQPGTFVSQDLRSCHSDLLFRTRLDQRDAFIYLLIEHQSKPERLMYNYVGSIWDRYVADHPGTQTLPMVLPVVVHATRGRRRWRAPTELSQLIDLDPDTRAALGDYLPRFQFLLDDLATVDIAELCARDLTPQATMMLALIKTVRNNRQLGTDLLPLVNTMRTAMLGPGGKLTMETPVSYILLVGDTPTADLGVLTMDVGDGVASWT
ncbi:Rpn family recombination-promoting nuclease/putative transposase [Nocardia sp. NPDC050435]|uniref:Rpn family recombination-promoting nuclease/putative transposase n=1 Tax=Nocardia sp. NPDC050435 TaxID=3155040 RepID=UPI0033C7403F